MQFYAVGSAYENNFPRHPRFNRRLHYCDVELCRARLFWYFPNSSGGGIRLATRRIFHGDCHSKLVLGHRSAHFWRDRGKGDRSQSHYARRLSLCAWTVLSSYAVTPGAMQAYGILVGFGIAGTGFGVILAVVGRAASDEHRSMALAIATAAGSVGQVIGAPLAEYLLGFMSWQHVFITFAAIIIGSLIFLPMMKTERVASRSELEESIGEVLIKAFKDPSYTLIFLGFFSCGYQLAFITAHFPAFVTELCGPIMPGGALHSMGITTTSRLGALAISLIGLANIAGTLAAGYLGKRYSKKYLLSGIYLARTIVAALFIALPITPISVILFSVVMGSLWLATVPAHLWFGRAYLWVALHGHALWHCLFLPPTRQFPWSLARGARCMTSMAPIPSFGGLESELACSAPSYICQLKSSALPLNSTKRGHQRYDEDKRI